MKKIAIITAAVSLPNEKGYTRFRFLSDLLAKNGFEVDLITSTFQHWDKKQRNLEAVSRLKEDYNIITVYEPGYKKNIDIRRIISHSILSRNILKYLKTSPKYDLIYCVIPPNNLARTVAEFASENNIPIIIDVEDLWPEAMRMVVDIPIISDILFWKFSYDAKKTYRLADAIVGTSDEYRDVPLKYVKSNIPRITIYVGNELCEFDEGVKQYGNDIKKNTEEFWISYAGTIGTSYDIKTLIEAAGIIKSRGINNIKFMLMGDGPLKNEMVELASKIDCNVQFLGYLPYPKMAAYLYKSDVVVNSFVRKAPQSIVTKIGDYLASGKPMINTCVSKEFWEKVEKDGFGINVQPENAVLLADAIEKLYYDKESRERMGQKARYIAEKEFDRSKSYLKIIDLINNMIK